MSDTEIRTVKTAEEAIEKLSTGVEAVEIEREDGENIPCDISTESSNE